MATATATTDRDETSRDWDLARLPLARIRMDGGTQPRDQIDHNTVVEYAEAYANGEEFPPPVAFYDGKHYWLADGFHRVTGARRAKLAELVFRVCMGEKRDAVLYACGANGSHGLRRTNADKVRAVMRLLNDDEWGTWSNKRIAAACGVTPGMVGANRVHALNPRARTDVRLVERDGKSQLMNTGSIGRSRPAGRAPADAGPQGGEARVFVPPQQATARSPIHEYARSLRVADVAFRQDVRTPFGTISFETDDALILVVPLISASSFRDALASVLYMRLDHAPAKKAVIVGQIMDDARPWIARARHWKVEVKSIG